MLRRKSILWLTLLLLVAIGTTTIWHHQRQKRKAAAALQAKSKKKKKSEPVAKEDPSDTPPPAPVKVPKVTVLGPAAKEHLAEKAFIAALRAVFIWRISQPDQPETNRLLVEKLSMIPCEDLSPDCKSAWHTLLETRGSLRGSLEAMPPDLKERDERAAEILNAMLKRHGDGDVVL